MPMISNDELGLAIICMVRYALYKRTYVVSQVIEFVRKNYAHLSENDRKVLRRELEQELSFASEINDTVGDKIDDDEWRRLLSFLKKENSHVESCNWHTDWHACNCGAFDK